MTAACSGGISSFTLSNINFGISNYSHDKVQIYFEPPNIIHLFLQNIKAWGKFNVSFELLISNVNETINFDIKQLSVEKQETIEDNTSEETLEIPVLNEEAEQEDNAEEHYSEEEERRDDDYEQDE